MKKVGIIIVTYNVSDLLDSQILSIRKNCTDKDYKIIVIDNSTNSIHIDNIEKYCTKNNIIRVKVDYNVFDPSTNHAMALNFAYYSFSKKFDYLFFLDHDLFPIKKFNVSEIMYGKLMAGREVKLSNTYLWPGCLMIAKLEEKVDFIPVNDLDTGGRLHTVVSKDPNSIVVFDLKNQSFGDDVKFNNYFMHEYYELIFNETFMHFIKASNWCNVTPEIFKARQDLLIKTLNDYNSEK
jgi:glycosyltransferase involved in cell wall biosynthesis